MWFLFPAIHRRCAHIHANCARSHAHKQTHIHIDTSTIVQMHHLIACTHTCAHSHLRALTLARTQTLIQSHSYTFTRARTHTLSHSRTLTVTITHQTLSHTLSHTPSHIVTVARTYTCTLANLQAHSRAPSIYPYTLARMHTLTFVHTHNIAHTCTRMHAQSCGLPHSAFYLHICNCKIPLITLLCLLDT